MAPMLSLIAATTLAAASPAAAPPTIVATEYAFDGVEAEQPRGTASFGFRNAGKETHEALLVRINPGHTLKAALDANLEGKAAKVVAFTYAAPGKRGKALKAKLTTGRYAFVCMIPDRKKRPHHSLGQVARFRVK